MANGTFDPEAKYAQLGERVDNQGSRISNLETVVSRGFAEVGSQIRGLSDEFRGGQKTQWPVIWSALGVCFAVFLGIGGALYYPVRETMAETKADIRLITERALSVAAFQDFKSTYENNRVVSRNEYIDKFGAVNIAIGKINEQMVPRAELERAWTSEDQQRAQMQKQIDELKQGQASTYSARDVILDLRERLDRVERQRFDGPQRSQ
ncbi:hypothetical protein [Pararhizobium gei]|uniref:hypothetical protein n=1 Tax=Pararhizobium gei TaxID=1395951 RepID=UPI0023DC90D8|nr:hypothetical protein [Rhizobium gei]